MAAAKDIKFSFENFIETGLVSSQLMKRTFGDWGLRDGANDPLAPLLLQALRAKASSLTSSFIERGEGIGAQVVRLVDQLVRRTGLNEAQLASDLAHDLALWETHRVVVGKLFKSRATRGPVLRRPSANGTRSASSPRASGLIGARTPGVPGNRRPTTHGASGDGGQQARIAAPPSAAGSPSETPTASGGTRTRLEPIPNKRGPRAIKRKGAIGAMLTAVETGTITRDILQRMPQKQLDTIYPDAKRTTLAEARKSALRQLSEEAPSKLDLGRTGNDIRSVGGMGRFARAQSHFIYPCTDLNRPHTLGNG